MVSHNNQIIIIMKSLEIIQSLINEMKESISQLEAEVAEIAMNQVPAESKPVATIPKKATSYHYVVWVGKEPGVYNNWSDTTVAIGGEKNAKFKKFETLALANAAFNDSYSNYLKN